MPKDPEVSDCVISLRPMTLRDAETHLAGEDEVTVRFLSGGKSTIDTVSAWIERNQRSWQERGPVRCFGIRRVATDALIGMIEANLALAGFRDGVANISYGLYPAARGNGYATRAVKLMVDDLCEHTDAHTAMIQVQPENALSVAVAERSGFRFVGERISMDGDCLKTFVLPLRPRPRSSERSKRVSRWG